MIDTSGGKVQVGPTSATSSRQGSGTRHRDALRLLFILCGGSQETTAKLDPDVTHVFKSEKRLMAIDFLVRYPDYLADALLDRFENDGDIEALSAAEAIFAADEPSVRTVNMVRWHFGAYEKIETALATLNAYGFVRPMKLVKEGENKRYDYYIYPKAFAFLESAVEQVPALSWYRDRVVLAMHVAAAKSGSDLKGWQYEHEEYSKTPRGGVIPSIAPKVMNRMRKLQETAL